MLSSGVTKRGHSARFKHESGVAKMKELSLVFKSKRKLYRRTGHESLERDYSYNSSLSLNSALVDGWVAKAMPRPLLSLERKPTLIL